LGYLTSHQRKSIRLDGWDYSSPWPYFVTIRAHHGHTLFETPDIAAVINWAWRGIPDHFPSAGVDAFVVMPNHVHGIIVLKHRSFVGARHASPLRTRASGPAPRSLGALVSGFKSTVTRELRSLGLWDGSPFWQRNYYERIIRDDDELVRVRSYIAENPANWSRDVDNPVRIQDDQYQRDWAWLEARA
jgi:REP element-mobilizing transposase RayT